MLMKFKLSNIDLDEVSLVDNGDNPHARVMLVKRAPDVSGDPFGGEAVTDATVDGMTLFVKTEGGRIFQSESWTHDSENDEWEIRDPELLVDLEEGPGDSPVAMPNPPESADLGPLAKLFNSFFGFIANEHPELAGEVEKARFKESMQSRIAEQAYGEMSVYTDALRGALDIGLYNGESADQLKASVSEFSDVMNKAIDKWTQGELLKADVDSEVLDHTEQRDEEVLKGNSDEGEAEDVNEEVDSGESAGESEEEEKTVAGVDRSKLSAEEAAYLDRLEAGAAAAASRPPDAPGAVPPQMPGEGQGELREGVAVQNGAEGIPPESTVGEDGTHYSPFEQELAKLDVSPAVKAIMRMQQAQIEKLSQGAQRDEEQDFIEKAREDYADVPGANPEEIGRSLYRIEKNQATGEDVQLIQSVLQTATAMSKAGGNLFDATARFEKGTGGTARGELMAKARSYANENKVDMEVALGAVRQDPENSDLVLRYEKEAL